jgi:hypothetical protein
VKAGLAAREANDPSFATSASLDLVELLVVASVGQDYPDLADAGKAQIDAARPTTRPLNPTAGQTRLFPA